MTDSVNYSGRKKQGLAIVCFVCGILAIVSSFLLIGIIFGIVGVIVGLIRIYQQPETKGLLFGGLILSVIGIGLGLVFVYVYVYVIFPAFKTGFQQGISAASSTPTINVQTLPGPPLMKVTGIARKITLQKVWEQAKTQGEC